MEEGALTIKQRTYPARALQKSAPVGVDRPPRQLSGSGCVNGDKVILNFCTVVHLWQPL